MPEPSKLALDVHALERFVAAQNPVIAGVYGELAAGDKQTHWMWFVFPQLLGLAKSQMSIRYAIRSRAEAEAYLEHPTLGGRLRQCTRLVCQHSDRSITDILGEPDDLKFWSSMTLFSSVAPGEPVFVAALDQFFSGERDPRTRELLDEHSSAVRTSGRLGRRPRSQGGQQSDPPATVSCE